MHNQHDIYRGSDQPTEPTPSLSSSSSSSSSAAVGPIAAIAAKLELAISRWARHSASDDESDDDLSRSHISRKHRRAPSISSEREIALRISRLKALREYSHILRGFTLFLPTPHVPQISSTTSLPQLLAQLDPAIRSFAKRRRQRHRTRASDPSSRSSSHYRPDRSLQRPRKGKQHDKPARIPEEPQSNPHAWFLDVASPTWADLQAIGKLLHIHPLTLEDILQQDPREKVEDFPNLGYYFISFRTTESQAARERFHREAGLLDYSAPSQRLDEGFIGETNVYLTIFIHGICCFHYTDVSEHTDRIRHLLENNVNRSSDWIAHTILDSIVDSFFPILEEIDQEVSAIDQTVFSDTDSSQLQDLGSNTKIPARHAEKTLMMERTISEKWTPSYRTRFVSPRLTISLLFRRARRHFNSAWRRFWRQADTPSATQSTLRRMARVKKLIVVLGRLLSSKSDVMTGIKKRLIKAIESRPDDIPHGQTPEEVEIAIYMTDIQDHILALQMSLAHNERMLSHSHPAYMSNLRSELEMTKSGIDIKVLYLSTATVTVLCMQTVTGLFSMNCHVPHNQRHPQGKYVVFGLVLAAAAIITASMFALVHHWWKKAKRRRNTSLSKL